MRWSTDELQLRHAVVNLVMNSIQALTALEGGTVVMETVNKGDELAIIVRDDGPGIPTEIRGHIFDPFFTTKAPGDGTGLGLPTSRRIVDAQGGRLTLVEADPGASVFEILVPRARFPRATPSSVVPIRAAAAGRQAGPGSGTPS